MTKENFHLSEFKPNQIFVEHDQLILYHVTSTRVGRGMISMGLHGLLAQARLTFPVLTRCLKALNKIYFRFNSVEYRF